MFCKYCGKQIKDETKFCPFCGQNIIIKATVNKATVNKATVNKATVNEATVNEATVNETTVNEANNTNTVKKQKKTKRPVVIGIVTVVIIGLIIYGIIKPRDVSKGVLVSANAHSEINSSSDNQLEEEPLSEQPPGNNDDVKNRATRTIMIYMIGSNLESEHGSASEDIDEILAADIPDDVNVILECGGSTQWVNAAVPDGEVTRFIIKSHKLDMLQKLGKISMTAEGVLSDFISYSTSNYPAENYTIVFWDHGGGIPVGFGCDELGDFHDLLTSYEIRNEMDKADCRFDVVIFDACNVGTLEMSMALREHSDYLIGAETIVAGAGMYYTNWLAYANGDCQKFCEIAAKDYINEIHNSGYSAPVSMSLIRLDCIEEVYNRYIEYLSLVFSEMNTGGFEQYAQVRLNYDDFNDVDSIDLVTLATKYENDNSTGLQNAVTNAVVWTESDVSSGHGITTYCPIKYDCYTEGRKAFVELNYDQSIISFYDDFVSRILSCQDSNEINAYAGDWYISSYAANTSNKLQRYTLDTEVLNNSYYATPVIDVDLWNALQRIELDVEWTFDDERYIAYGTDYQFKKDADGRLILAKPNSWVMINGHVAMWICNSYDYKEDEVEFTGFIPAYLNNEKEIALYIVYNSENPNGIVVGYVDFDILNETYLSNEVQTFSENDYIDLAFVTYTDSEKSIAKQNDPVYARDIELTYEDFRFADKVKVWGRYRAYDVYGNIYETEWCQLGDYE